VLTEAQVQQFNRDGFLRGARVLTDEQVEELRDELARVIDNRDNPASKQPALLRNLSTGPDTVIWQVVNIWQASEPFRELLYNRTICEEMAQLTGAKTLRVWHDQIQYKPAETGGVNMWHQDAPLWPVLAPMTEVSAWVALDDVDADNGCMSMVPGSHKWGNRIEHLFKLKCFDDMPREFEGHPIEVRVCPVAKGEVHYHHALTWHGSPANASGRPRRAIAIHFMTEETRYVASGFHEIKDSIKVADGESICGASFPVLWEAKTPSQSGR
jgi:ectoine hydroxylase-related dioxygenase (phytanoyl-CoA dioxygenase family)